MRIIFVDLKQNITETVQDPPIRRTQQYTSGHDGLFSFPAPSQSFSFSPSPRHRTTVQKMRYEMRGTW